jgi:hypothetical protein
MSGSIILSDKEKREMIADAENKERAGNFEAARHLNSIQNIDAYIEFLSENLPLFSTELRVKITKNNKL